MFAEKIITKNSILKTKKNIKIIISGGGTGGHVYPAIAIANAIKKINSDADILFVGAQDKLEMEKVPKAGYPIEGLWISGFHRKLTLRNLMFPIKLLSSLWKARGIIKKFKPDAAVGVGGFASGPTLEMAARQNVPILVQEQNSYPGVTNKLLAKKATTICVSYPEMERFFPKEKMVMTGNPVRQDIVNLAGKRDEACQHFGFDPSKKIVFLTGGSLGASNLNKSVNANVKLLRENPDVQLLWQSGKLYIETYKNSDAASLSNVKISAFIDRMDLAYAMADVVICRAGALTISELCLAKKAAILIPSPNVAEDHQTVNAKALEKKQAAILITDAAAESKMIQAALDLLKNEKLKSELQTNIGKLAKINAAEAIAKEVLKMLS